MVCGQAGEVWDSLVRVIFLSVIMSVTEVNFLF